MSGWFIEQLRGHGNAPAIIWRGETFTYSWLVERIAAWGREFESAGILPGMVISVEAEYSPNACALFYALMDNGNIIVPMAGLADTTKDEYLGLAEVQFSFKLDQEAWRMSRSGRVSTHGLYEQLRSAGHPGLVIFTSGSTGKAKAVVHDLDRLGRKLAVGRAQYRTLVFYLFDHMAGIHTLIQVLSAGGSIVCCEDRLPGRVCELVERHNVELLPVPPTFLNLMLLSGEHLGHDMTSLKVISYGSEPMTSATLQRLHDAFPNVRLQQTYGLSELGVLRTKSRSSESQWVTVGGAGFEVKVKDGTLWIKAESAMVGYLNAPQPFDEEGWFNTGDVVEQDGEYLRILGRASDLINVGGQKVFPTEVEAVIAQMPEVADVVVYGEPNPIMGNIVVAQVQLLGAQDRRTFVQAMRLFCQGRLEAHKVPVKVVLTDQIQRTVRFKKARGGVAERSGSE